MEIYRDSFVSEDKFDFGSILPYFRNSVVHTRSKYETLMDPLSDKIKYLPESKRLKYTKFMMNIIAHLRVLSRRVEDLNIPENDLESDIEISYV